MLSKRTTCYQCDANCVFDISINEQGHAVAIKGPPCVRGEAQLAHQYHPNRLLKPLKRVGKKGEDNFIEITWEEALETIAERLQSIKKTYGAEQVAFFSGYTKEARPYLQRLAHAFGSPNYLTESGCCFSATLVAEKLTYGYRLKTTSLLESPKTRCILVWSTNPYHSVMPFDKHHLSQKKADRKLIVVDPRKTETAQIADIHLQIRPGTDGALALAFHHVIFKENLHNQTFLEQWANGIESFKDYIQIFTPEKASEICGIDKDLIIQAARLYAQNTPAQLALSPTATVHHSNGFQNHRAVILLAAVTGNIDNEGGNRFFLNKVLPKSIDLFKEKINTLAPRIGDSTFPIWTKYWPSAHSMLLVNSILEHTPQAIHGVFAMGINSTMWPNSKRFLQALEKLDFFACIDFFPNQATRYADIVLPAATALERETLIAYPGCQFKGNIRYREAILKPLGEARSDAQIILDLGCKLGMEETFWYGNMAQSIQEQAQGLPEQIREAAFHHPEGATVFSEVIMEMEGGDKLYELKGFPTASGKIEFDSIELIQQGYQGLPTYQEPPESPIATPELWKKYPLVLTSGGRSQAYTHSQQHNIENSKKIDPYPRVQMHPQDAKTRNIQTGDKVIITSLRGEVYFIAEVTEHIKQGIVHCFHGWEQANVNLLTDDQTLDPISGFPAMKSCLCEISKTL